MSKHIPSNFYVVGDVLEPVERLKIEVARLKTAIRKHRDARGHDRCWENDLELYRVLGEPLPDGPALPCREEFLRRCAEYYQEQTKRETP